MNFIHKPGEEFLSTKRFLIVQFEDLEDISYVVEN